MLNKTILGRYMVYNNTRLPTNICGYSTFIYKKLCYKLSYLCVLLVTEQPHFKCKYLIHKEIFIIRDFFFLWMCNYSFLYQYCFIIKIRLLKIYFDAFKQVFTNYCIFINKKTSLVISLFISDSMWNNFSTLSYKVG